MHKSSYKEEFEGDTERRTAAYSNVREDSSTGSTYKLPLEDNLCRKSNFASLDCAHVLYIRCTVLLLN
ncbi:MAG TPA: palindromic element RPE1 domain-containing protein [Rickettsia endosymbiont of Omalisus fontisbellaquei]|nr:palindromic element RPE1 domain-containing protein [Rickettsia endosymbiont of Omalisus fontisbellaquei]